MNLFTNAVFAFELMGQQVPTGAPAIVIVLFMVGIFFASRGDFGSGGGNRVGKGEVHTCDRCGRRFQPEQVELMSNGETRHWYDERCPNCGWELDWGSPHEPGGSSGRW